jgi:GMP synthase-like glutamine amidotransferase
MKILIVDNNMDQDCWGAHDIRTLTSSYSSAEIVVRRGPSDDLPNSIKEFDRMIISGSRSSCLHKAPWVEHLDYLIKEFANHHKPILGICYGHQSICRALAGSKHLNSSKTPEYGWTQIQVLKPNPLFNGLPKSFYSYSSHYEEISSLPDHFDLLASSKNCVVQAYQVRNQAIYGFQFHPEKSLEDGSRSLMSRLKRKELTGLLHPLEGKKYFDPKVGQILFQNFLALKNT